MREHYVDLGDGTFARAVAVVAEAAGSSSAAEGIGSPSDPPWNGTDPSASLIAVLKACYLQLVAINLNTGT